MMEAQRKTTIISSKRNDEPRGAKHHTNMPIHHSKRHTIFYYFAEFEYLQSTEV